MTHDDFRRKRGTEAMRRRATPMRAVRQQSADTRVLDKCLIYSMAAGRTQKVKYSPPMMSAARARPARCRENSHHGYAISIRGDMQLRRSTAAIMYRDVVYVAQGRRKGLCRHFH